MNYYGDRREVVILADYHDGIELLADHLHTTFDAVVNALIYKGLQQALTPDVIESGLQAQRDAIVRKLRLEEAP